MDRRLLDILCCPATRQPLEWVDAGTLEAINRAIAAHRVLTVAKQPRHEPLRAALITRDRKLVYPVEDDIPVLLADQAISAQQFTDSPA